MAHLINRQRDSAQQSISDQAKQQQQSRSHIPPTQSRQQFANKQKYLNGSGSRTPQLELETNIPLGADRSRRSQQSINTQHIIATIGGGQGTNNNKHGMSKSLNTSHEIMNANNKGLIKNILARGEDDLSEQRNQGVINSDRAGGTVKSSSLTQQNNNRANFDQTYFGDSFQIQKESLKNLHQENDDDLLRDAIPSKLDEFNGPYDEEQDSNEYAVNDDTLNISPINATNNNISLRVTDKIENLNFEVQLKSIVSRIKDYTNQIKDRVKVQRELSESFIQTQLDNEDDEEMDQTLDNNFEIGIGKQENGLDVSAILFHKPNQLDKSAFVAEDTSMLINQAPNGFSNNNDDDKDASFLIGNNEEKFTLNKDSTIVHQEDVKLHINEQEELNSQQQQRQQISLQLLEKIVRDLQSKHKAEKDMLTSELAIFKKVIHLMGAKIRYLQDEIMDKDKLERDLFKVTHLNMKLENQYKRMREENRKLSEKVEVMRKVMYEFDMQMLEEHTHDNHMIEQLIRENHQLQRLLLIAESGGLKDYTSIEDQLKQLESQTVNLMSSADYDKDYTGKKGNQLSYYNKKKGANVRNGSGENSTRASFIPEPLNQSMPNEIKHMILERQMVKEDERRINLEMRRIAEEEIMRELKMAEEYYIQSEFQKTNKNFPIYKDSDLSDVKDDDGEGNAELSSQQQHQRPQHLQEEDDDKSHQQQNSYQNPPPSSPQQETVQSFEQYSTSVFNEYQQEQPGNQNQTAIHQSDDHHDESLKNQEDGSIPSANDDLNDNEYQEAQNIFKNSASYIDEDDEDEVQEHINDNTLANDDKSDDSEEESQFQHQQHHMIHDHVLDDQNEDSHFDRDQTITRVGNEQR